MTPDQILESTIRTYLEKTKPSTFQNVICTIQRDLEILTENGVLDLGPDIELGGYSLEIKTKLIFLNMGFNVARGRDGFEDFVIHSSKGMKPIDPLVIEVKSSRKPNISRDDLRQLDDWVFDLSGEEEARKHGLGGGFDALSFATNGMISLPKRHPSPHKGVMIFNGPIGVPFKNRPKTCISHNELDFITKRNLCIIPLNILLDYFVKFQDRSEIKEIFWNSIHKTIGQLEII